MFSKIYTAAFRQNLLLVFQWLIPVISIYLIWIIIESKTDNQALWNVWTHSFNNVSLIWFFVGMILLSSINIIMEAKKWQLSFRHNLQIPFLESVQQTFLAMAAGFITPLKSGALLARIIANSKADPFTVLNSTLRMAIAQFTITFFAGMIGLIYLLQMNNLQSWAVLTSIFAFCCLGFLLFYPALSLSFYYKNRKWDGVTFDLDLIFLSLIRYIAFTAQYILILIFFSVQSDLFFLTSLVTVTYLVNSLIPTGALGKLDIRELSGILIIGEQTGFIAETSCAAFFIWILNQAVPSIIGSGLFIHRNIQR